MNLLSCSPPPPSSAYSSAHGTRHTQTLNLCTFRISLRTFQRGAYALVRSAIAVGRKSKSYEISLRHIYVHTFAFFFWIINRLSLRTMQMDGKKSRYMRDETERRQTERGGMRMKGIFSFFAADDELFTSMTVGIWISSKTKTTCNGSDGDGGIECCTFHFHAPPLHL